MVSALNGSPFGGITSPGQEGQDPCSLMAPPHLAHLLVLPLVISTVFSSIHCVSYPGVGLLALALLALFKLAGAIFAFEKLDCNNRDVVGSAAVKGLFDQFFAGFLRFIQVF